MNEAVTTALATRGEDLTPVRGPVKWHGQRPQPAAASHAKLPHRHEDDDAQSALALQDEKRGHAASGASAVEGVKRLFAECKAGMSAKKHRAICEQAIRMAMQADEAQRPHALAAVAGLSTDAGFGAECLAMLMRPGTPASSLLPPVAACLRRDPARERLALMAMRLHAKQRVESILVEARTLEAQDRGIADVVRMLRDGGERGVALLEPVIDVLRSNEFDLQMTKRLFREIRKELGPAAFERDDIDKAFAAGSGSPTPDSSSVAQAAGSADPKHLDAAVQNLVRRSLAAAPTDASLGFSASAAAVVKIAGNESPEAAFGWIACLVDAGLRTVARPGRKGVDVCGTIAQAIAAHKEMTSSTRAAMLAALVESASLISPGELELCIASVAAWVSSDRELLKEVTSILETLRCPLLAARLTLAASKREGKA